MGEGGKKGVLFVCLGNICRSPTAEVFTPRVSLAFLCASSCTPPRRQQADFKVSDLHRPCLTRLWKKPGRKTSSTLIAAGQAAGRVTGDWPRPFPSSPLKTL